MASLLQPSGRAALVTLKRDGRPQLSNIVYTYNENAGLVRISVTDSRAKTRNLRRDPRASLYLTNADYTAYEVVDGMVELMPVARTTDDPTVDELVDVYRSISGEHPDWAEFRSAMVADERLVVRFTVGHRYGGRAG
jgi:PPOX class probable F420-dependent enzyme